MIRQQRGSPSTAEVGPSAQKSNHNASAPQGNCMMIGFRDWLDEEEIVLDDAVEYPRHNR
jgi:hypothetical protein